MTSPITQAMNMTILLTIILQMMVMVLLMIFVTLCFVVVPGLAGSGDADDAEGAKMAIDDDVEWGGLAGSSEDAACLAGSMYFLHFLRLAL